jgi:dienelactone hydrolase
MTTRPPRTALTPASTRRRTLVYALWLAAFVAGAASFGFVRRMVAATSLLIELGTRGAPAPKVGVVDLVVQRGALRFPARLYLPRAPAHRCAVIGHGVHYKGIDEPRLVNFAERLAARGVVALTPELAELADYRITREGVDVLSAAVKELSSRCHGDAVGLIGFSFAGGLSLIAAGDPSVNAHLAYVASVGGYHDLKRELSFLLGDRVVTPRGILPRKAHEYGLVVLLYEHLAAFVPGEDLPVMQRAVHAWLTEDRKAAWAWASRSTTAAAERLFMDIATGKRDGIREGLARVLAQEGDDERALSPSGKLNGIPVPVYLLHGEGDSVIPPEETTWADAELGAHEHIALVSPLIEHVEIGGQPTIFDQWALVRFMSRLL